VTQGQKGLDDVWRYSDAYHPGYMGSDEISYNELLSMCNHLIGLDFTNFFQKYVSGNAPLPYYIEDGTLKINYSEIPEPTELPKGDGGGAGCFIGTAFFGSGIAN